MANLIDFKVGQTYKNRKGKFTVVAIDGDIMQISWNSGKEVAATTVTLQSRIIEHIQREVSEELALTKPVSLRKKTAVAV